MYALQDREHILDMLEGVTGSRLTYCYFRFGGLYNDVDDEFISAARRFIPRMRKSLKKYHKLVTGNIIFRKRLEGIAPLTQEMCRKYGASSAVARGSGINFDVRKNEPYSVYPEFDFDVPVFHECDSLARYNVRMEEIEQSLRIIEQGLDKLPDGPIMPEKKPKTHQTTCRRLLSGRRNCPGKFRDQVGQRRWQDSVSIEASFANLFKYALI